MTRGDNGAESIAGGRGKVAGARGDEQNTKERKRRSRSEKEKKEEERVTKKRNKRRKSKRNQQEESAEGWTGELKLMKLCADALSPLSLFLVQQGLVRVFSALCAPSASGSHCPCLHSCLAGLT